MASLFVLADSLTDVLSTIRPLADAKNIALRIEQDTGCIVYADRTRFKQILVNLLSNAVKFTPENGAVELRSWAKEEGVTVQVSDTGIGIALEEQAAIFDKFHQVGTSTRGIREGTGLGLAITKALVEQHGGKIWVESAPAAGSRFTFTLPYTDSLYQGSVAEADTAGTVEPERHVTAGPLGTASDIVVIEDNPANAALFRAMLQPPYRVVVYETGPEALKGVAKEIPQLVLLDISLPGMDGIEVLRRIRSDESLRRLPIVAVTAHAMAGDRELFLSAGFDAYVAKPVVDRSVLLGVVEPLLALRKTS